MSYIVHLQNDEAPKADELFLRLIENCASFSARNIYYHNMVSKDSINMENLHI